jgi:TonB family protein
MDHAGRRDGSGGHAAGIFVTVLLHGLLVVGAIVGPGEDKVVEAPRDFVVAKLVRLGKPRPKELLPRIVEPAPAAAPLPAAVKVTENVEAAPIPKKDKEEPKKPEPPKKDDPAAMKKASDRARLLAQQAEEAEGDPTGSAKGDAARAAAGDRYITEVNDVIKGEWRTPKGMISDAELKGLTAVVRIRIATNGRVTSAKITRSSGNRFFDDSITETFARVRKLPVPPPEIADSAVRSGFEIEFAGKDQ